MTDPTHIFYPDNSALKCYNIDSKTTTQLQDQIRLEQNLSGQFNSIARIIGQATPGELLLFDYSGEALVKYNLDRYVYDGAMDWERKIFYTFDAVEKVVVLFNLNLE